MFKRDARPEPEMPPDVRTLTDAELDERIEDLERRMVVQKNELYDRCVNRGCRRMWACAVDSGRCVCANVPRVGKRELKRWQASEAQSAPPGFLTPLPAPSKTRNVLGKRPRKPPRKAR